MNTLPINVEELAEEALDSFAPALLDDPTAWSNGAPLVSEVVIAVNEVVRDNYRSLLARRIGAQIQAVASDMEIAIGEDGPLADLSAVWSGYVNGMDLEDYDAVLKAKDWTARVEALSDLVGQRIHGAPAPSPTKAQIDAYVALDPRLADLAVSQKHGAAKAFEDTVPGAPAAGGFSWDDEDEAPAPSATAAGAPVPALFTALEAAGMMLTDVADACGISKATLSNAKNGKRPWSGLSEAQADKLADALSVRADEARDLARALRSRDPAAVGGNKA